MVVMLVKIKYINTLKTNVCFVYRRVRMPLSLPAE